MYSYLASHRWWGQVGSGIPVPTAITAAYVATNLADPTPGSSTMVSFPSGTIEIKSAWRLLNPMEISRHRFHTATARYYEAQGGKACWNQDTFGMVALHIIQKTPSAPYFVYATFEQSDNIRTADKGLATENDDGALIPGQQQPCRTEQASPCPLTPTELLADAPKPKGPAIYIAPSAPPTPAYCTPGKRVYFLEEKGLPKGGYICVNSRENAIPAEIIAVNAAAHAAIAQHDTPNDPFRHYKLINVQYFPIDLAAPSPGIYAGHNPNSATNRASFYMANGVVETDRSLQLFSGGLIQASGKISNYLNNFTSSLPTPFPAPSPPWATHKNTAYNHVGFDMGGCMGCHGSQGQSQGGDFSVITAEGTVPGPEAPFPNPHQTKPPAGKAKLNLHNRRLVSY